MDWDAYEEAERRGLLSPEQSELLAEARRRGLTGAPPQAQGVSRPEAAWRAGSNFLGIADNVGQSIVENVAKIAPETSRSIAERRLGPQARTMTPKQLGQAWADRMIRQPEAEAYQAHPVSSIAGTLAPNIVTTVLAGGMGPGRDKLAGDFAYATSRLPFAERMLVRGAQAAPVGAVTGGATSAANADAPGQSRVQAAALGAAIGLPTAAAFGAALPEVVSGGANVAKSGSGLANRFNLTPDQRAVRMIQKRVNPRTLAPTDGPEQIIDVGGKRLVGLADAAHLLDETPGSEIVAGARASQRGELQDFMLARGAGATGKDQAGYHASIEGLRNQRQQAAAPLYEAANQTPVGWEGIGRMAPFVDRIPKPLLAEADALARVEGNPSPTPFQRLDYISRALGQAADRESPMDLAGRRQSTELGRALYQLKAQFDEALFAMSENQPGGGLRAARDAYRGPSAQIEAQKLGRTLVKANNFDPEDLVARLSKMAPDEQDSLVMGLARGIADETEAGRIPAFARNLKNNRRLQQRLMMVLGQERYDGLVNATERAGNIVRNTDRITGNSSTASRQQAVRDATDGENEIPILAQDLLNGRPLSALPRYAARVAARNRAPGLRDPRVSEAVARRLTQRATPENIRALVDEMAGLDQYRGAALQPVLMAQPTRVYGAVGAAETVRPRGLFGRRRP